MRKIGVRPELKHSKSIAAQSVANRTGSTTACDPSRSIRARATGSASTGAGRARANSYTGESALPIRERAGGAVHSRDPIDGPSTIIWNARVVYVRRPRIDRV